MTTVRIVGEAGSVELERAEFGGPNTPADEDILLNISVQVRGYSAQDQMWISAGAWRLFLERLVEVERTRRGGARVEGASPEDLALEIFSTDSVGHFAVRGHVGWTPHDGHRLRLEFALAFETDRLPYLLRELRALGAPEHVARDD